MKKDKTENIMGIDSNYVFDFIIGIVIGVLIFLFGKVFGVLGTIGIPLNLTISLDDLGRFLVVCVLAPICEEIFFRNFSLSFFDDKLENFGLKVPFFLAAILSSIVFSLFHLAAYSGSLSNFSASGGAFFSAALMGMVFAYEVKIFKSVLPAIMTHMVINFGILSAWMGLFA